MPPLLLAREQVVAQRKDQQRIEEDDDERNVETASEKVRRVIEFVSREQRLPARQGDLVVGGQEVALADRQRRKRRRGQQCVSGGEALPDLRGVAGIEEATSGRAAVGDPEQFGTRVFAPLALVGDQLAMPLLLQGGPAGAVRGGEEHHRSKHDRHGPKSAVRSQTAPLIAHDSEEHC